MILIYFFSFSLSAHYYNEGKKNEHIQPNDPSGIIIIQDTIFQTFHNIYSQLGGCIFVHDDYAIVKFSSLGFVDCRTSADGGAINIFSQAILIQNTCAFLCEATNCAFQFAKLECNVELANNTFSYITLVSCGSNNLGKTAIGIVGIGRFSTNNCNSSNNMNNYDDSSYGACFRTINIFYHKTTYINFVNSKGYDVINTDVSSAIRPGDHGSFDYGNIYNCSTKYIIIFNGIMTINHFKFGELDSSDGSFKCGTENRADYSLTFSNCQIDKYPIGLDSHIHINGGCQIENPIILHTIDLQATHYCNFLTNVFTKSEIFTKSSFFTQSTKFSSSIIFSPSSQFSPSIFFTPSSKFSSSITFSPSSQFSSSHFFMPSSKFSSSIIFSHSEKFTLSMTFLLSKNFNSSQSFSQSFKFILSNYFSVTLILFHFESSFYFPSPSETATFTPSLHFTPSFIFSPNEIKLEQAVNAYSHIFETCDGMIIFLIPEP